MLLCMSAPIFELSIPKSENRSTCFTNFNSCFNCKTVAKNGGKSETKVEINVLHYSSFSNRILNLITGWIPDIVKYPADPLSGVGSGFGQQI